MVRVLHVCNGMNRGGIETFIMNLYRTMDRSQVQFDFLLSQRECDYRVEIENLGGHIYTIPARNKGFMQYRANLDDFFRSNAVNYDAVHLHRSSLSSIEPLQYAKKYGIKNRIIHAHSTNQSGFLHLMLHCWHKLFIHSAATHYYACSDKAQTWMYRYTGINSKVKIINNGIIISNFRYDLELRSQMRQSLGIAENEVVLGLVANLIPVKNHKFLIEIFREFKQIMPGSKLLIVGRGRLEREIKAQIERENLTGSVLCLGKRTDIASLLQAIDAFVMPSFWEGLPVSLIEAQTSGLPVFCSGTISPMSKVTDNYYSLSLSLSAEEWAEFIKEKLDVFERKDVADRIISAGFDIENIARRLMKDYQN